MTKSLPTGGCQQGALPAGDAANFHQHQASSSLLKSAVHPGPLLTSERPARSETHMGGASLETFPRRHNFPLPFSALQLPQARFDSFPALLPLRAATDLVHHQEVLQGLPIGKDQVPGVLHSFREDLLYLLSNDTYVETAQWVKLVWAGLLLPQLFLRPTRSSAGPCSLGTTQGLSSLLPSLCRARQSSSEAPRPHTGSATEEQRLFRQGWFPDAVGITPLQCVAVPLERGGYLEKPYHRSPISHLREVLCSLLPTKEGISLDA